jgi:DNA-binding NarL/FixJ family response regulator
MSPLSDTTRPERILVVDDHPLFCDALLMTITAALPQARVATASRLSEALAAIERDGAPDLAMVDLNLPDVEGFDGLARLHAAAPDTRFLVVSSMASRGIVTAALAAGANGFVPKDAPRGALIAALERIRAGGVAVPEDYVPLAAGEDGPADREILERLGTLTPRQARILELVCAGKLNKQIAFDLSISETTVKAHVTAILRKLSVSSRTQAVLAAQQVRFASVLNDPS